MGSGERAGKRASFKSVVSLPESICVNRGGGNLWMITLRRGKTDLDRRVWLLRIHDYGLGRLHIHELVLDLFHALQGKFLGFFGRLTDPPPREATAWQANENAGGKV